MQRTGTHGRRLIAALPVIVLILLILVDQLTKLYFHLYGVKGKDITVIPGFFYLNFSTNTGAAFGSLSDKEWAQVFFKITTALALIGLTVFYYFAADHGNWLKYGLILVIGGAVGNFACVSARWWIFSPSISAGWARGASRRSTLRILFCAWGSR